MPKAAQTPRETEAEVARAIRIIPEAIKEEYAAVPADITRWATRVSQADELLQRAEAELEAFEAQEVEAIFLDAEKNDRRPPPEDRRKSLVRGRQGYKERVLKVIEAKAQKAREMAVLEGVRAKKEMLVSLGADLRIEYEGGRELAIRDREGRGRRL